MSAGLDLMGLLAVILDMVLPQADWKNQAGHTLDWLILVIGGLLTAINLLIWWAGGGPAHLVLAAIVAAWGIVFFTEYWQPVLSLVVGVVLAATTITILWNGEWRSPLVQAKAILTGAFVALSFYLFRSEEPTIYPYR